MTMPLQIPRRDFLPALWRCVRLRCPNCGKGPLFRKFLKVSEQCRHCDEALHHHRADDAPAYFVIAIVAHIVVPLAIAVEAAFQPHYWTHFLLWFPMTIGLSLFLLSPVKGAIIAFQWANRMHGFAGIDEAAAAARQDVARLGQTAR